MFEKKWTPNDNLIASTTAMVRCMTHTNDCPARTKVQGAILAPSRESWRPLEEDWVKVNVDGAHSTITSRSACGGLVRDSLGKFLKGFIYHIDQGDAPSAEL